MPYYCTHCKISWLRLHSQDEGEEVYEYCPSCKNNLNLIKTHGSPAFIQCVITGRIYDPITGKDHVHPSAVIPAKDRESFDPDKWKREKEEWERKQIERIDKYIAESETIGKEKATQNYFNV